MQASTTGIRQSVTDIRHRWSNAKLKKLHVFWVVIGAIVLTLFLGFSRWGWMTEASATRMATTSANGAVLERLTPICVAQFDADPQRAQKLEELKAVTSYQRTTYVKDQGWATMPGETAADSKVASECTRQLMLIGG